MLDLDDLEEAEGGGNLVVEEAGELQDLPPGRYKFPTWSGGCGKDGKLKLLCFHGMDSNADVMKMQMSKNFMDKDISALVECVYVQSPHDSPPGRQSVIGKPTTWFDKAGCPSPDEQWINFPDAIEEVCQLVVKHGPVDGLCGFSAGGELCCQVARLAEDGREDLQGQFKFLLCMSTRFPKVGVWPDCRPKRVSSIPLFHTCSRGDDTTSPCDFDDLILHWRPECREVVWHDDGHRIPKYEETNLARLRCFIKAFHSGAAWQPIIPGSDDPIGGLTLPIPQQAPAVLRSPSVVSPLPVIIFDDTLGYTQLRGNPSEELKKAVGGTSLSGTLSLDPLEARIDKRAPEKPACPMHFKHHIVPSIVRGDLAPVISSLLDGSPYLEGPVVVLGIGSGAYTALQYAQALCARGGHVWQLFGILAPVIFPNPVKGGLKSCKVTLVLPQHDTGGTWWRWEMATHGPLETKVVPFQKIEDWASVVAEDLAASLRAED